MAEAGRHSISQGNFISCDPNTAGFDLSSGAKWIYPENYPRREYQFNIVQTALYNNTLVCLPTGLGKTFIAAVVMYNFWRWYPRGRVVFLAPTKPLVAQQINACHEIMGIPSDETIELTGAINQTKRAIAWAQKRVIFATPQTFQKDLQNGYVPYDLIKCIVIDEAHKALGKHSYCEIVRMVNEKNQFYRVLALSATPGSKIDHVREVIQNLLISELELRDDTSPDITPYTNDRSMEKIIVNLDQDLKTFKDRYINIMDPHVRILIKSHILQGSAANISKGRIFILMKQYESRPNKAQNHGTIMKTLNILLTMYHAYELLLKHGLRAFYHFYLNHSDKFWLEAEVELKLMLEDIKQHIGDFPVIQPSDDGDIPDVMIPDNLVFGHSKFNKLQELLVDHFRSFALQNKSTRAIVFVEYRDIVNEVYVLLLQTRPLIRPKMFVGQAGQKQKLQLAALEDFRSNKVNVLISTSVGEEGLDVGEVDLIVCFDISTSTPTRLVQRMGRTGRKRSGRVVLLLTEGKEVQILNQAISKKDSLNNKVLQSSNIASSLYQSSPRMVPQSINPECLPMFIKTLPKTPKVKGKKGPAQNAAAEKKCRKRKKDIASFEIDDNLALPSTSMASSTSSQSKTPPKSKSNNNHKSVAGNQPSMMKFLTDQRQLKKSLFPQDTDSGFVEDFQLPERDNPYSFIRPHEVKLLTSDSVALEFLTLCAIKKSDESSSSNTLELDLKWLPPRSPPIEDMFRDLKIPSTENLECIKNLKLSENLSIKSDDDGLELTGVESNVYNEFSREDEGMNDFIDNFEEIEVKRVAAEASMQKKDLQENIEISASDFFCTFDDKKRQSIVLSQSVKQSSQKNLDEAIEISASDFFSSFDGEKPVNSTIVLQNDDSKKDCQSSSSNMTPANVEVDFENLLDEDTESEVSESPALLPPGGENIFDDDLLDGGSSTTDDEDLFVEQDSEQNVTVVPNLNETVRAAKRSASVSPKRDSPPKKQKLSHLVSDCSDNESTIMGTPPMTKKPSQSAFNDLISPVKEVEEPDSEEDIFDGLDAADETFFFEEKGANDEVAEQMSGAKSVFLKDDKNSSLGFQEDWSSQGGKKSMSTISMSQENNFTPLKGEHEVLERNISATPMQLSREDENKSPVLSRENKSSLVFEDTIVELAVERGPSPVLSLSRKSQNTIVNVQNNNKEIGPVAMSVDDWFDDDFDFVPIAKKANNFFPLEAPTKSTGWISAGQSQQKKNGLSIKNWCSTNSKKPDVSESTILTATVRPKLQLSKLKATQVSKDKDGFAMPVAPKSDKENHLPVWRQRLNTDKSTDSVSPRFRKYHSESDLCSSIEKERMKEKRQRRRPKARKRIVSDFIEEEADVSSDCNTSEGSSDDEQLDADLDSFVSYTQDVSEVIDMRAHYLQTINKSPIRAGAFMIKQVKRKVPDIEVFSQPVSREEMEESYLYDSFCVGDETQMNGHDSEPEESMIEKIETRLESRRRKLKEDKENKFSKFKSLRQKKRSADSNIEPNDDSSEDEAEALRKQIMEDSIMLKR